MIKYHAMDTPDDNACDRVDNKRHGETQCPLEEFLHASRPLQTDISTRANENGSGAGSSSKELDLSLLMSNMSQMMNVFQQTMQPHRTTF